MHEGRSRRRPSTRAFARALAAGAISVVALSACLPLAPPPRFTPWWPAQRLDNPSNAASNQDFPDPSVVYAPDAAAAPGDPTFFAFSTNAFYPSPFDLPLVPTARSVDLRGWMRPGLSGNPANDAMVHRAAPHHQAGPDWQRNPYPASGPVLLNWAPDVHEFGSTWLLYFTAPSASSADQCVGVATATSVGGPYTPVDVAPLQCMHGWGGSIDPSVHVDEHGDPWLLWKNDGNCCNIATYLWSQPLAADGLSFVPGSSPTPLLGVDQPWENGSGGGREPWKNLVEAPEMYFDNGTYWLFYSANWWDSANYAVGYARCTTPAGPCSKPSDRPLLGSGPLGSGPGGQSVFADSTGQLWMAYHAWDPGRVGAAGGGSRTLRISRLSFAGDTPTLGAGP